MIKGLRENLLYVIIAHLCFLGEPAIVHAQDGNYDPQNFTQPLKAVRGEIIPVGDGGLYLKKDSACRFVTKEFGWKEESCRDIDRMLFYMTPELDTVLFSVPVSDGYVELGDWDHGDAAGEIATIEKAYKEGLVDQAKRTGSTIRFEGWLQYPTVDQSRKLLYYANILNWDGNRQINVSVSAFDRQGYVPIQIVPTDGNIASEDVRRVVEQVVGAYHSIAGSRYAEFTSGDKVASYGAVGVLATMLGVKYGKAATAGIVAVALILLKKAWFLLLLPFVWLGRLFGRKSSS